MKHRLFFQLGDSLKYRDARGNITTGVVVGHEPAEHVLHAPPGAHVVFHIRPAEGRGAWVQRADVELFGKPVILAMGQGCRAMGRGGGFSGARGHR